MKGSEGDWEKYQLKGYEVFAAESLPSPDARILHFAASNIARPVHPVYSPSLPPLLSEHGRGSRHGHDNWASLIRPTTIPYRGHLGG